MTSYIDKYIVYKGLNKTKEVDEEENPKEEDKKDNRWKNLLQLIAGMESPKTNVQVTTEYYPENNIEEKPENNTEQPIDESLRIPETPAPLWTPTEVRQYYNTEQMDKNIKLAYNELTEKWRFSPEVASGIIGNLFWENLANPGQTVADSRGTTSFGIASFNSKGRLPDLEHFIATHNLDKNNLAHQIAFIASSIHREKPLQVLKNSKLTPEQASEIFAHHFEKFAGKDGQGYKNYNDPEHIRRKKKAKEIYLMFN